MAVAFSDLTASQLADLAADYPLLLGKQSLEDRLDVQWRQGGLWSAGTNETDEAGGFYAEHAFDRRGDATTRPLTSQTTWYLMLQWSSAGTGVLGIFDTMVILNHNLGSNTATWTLQVADDNAFSVNLRTLATASPADDKRIVALTLAHAGAAKLYSQVEYARLLITAGGGFIPRIGELWLGQRRQMGAGIILAGHNPNRRISDFAEARTRGGTTNRVKYNTGALALSPTITLTDDAHVTEADSWQKECSDGTDPYVIIRNHSTAPLLPALVAERDGGGDHQAFIVNTSSVKRGFLSLDFVESQPFLRSEE